MVHRTPLHTGWEFVMARREDGTLGYSDYPWLPAQVPGHVHLDLIRAGAIADPHRRMQEIGTQWVDDEDWTYRTTFDYAPDPERPCEVLRFEGLDTVCTVRLNGEIIAEHDNMFVPLEIDVAGRLQAENELRVEFRSASKVGEERRLQYFAQEGLDPENTGRFDERAFVRKAQYMFGWDWGPRLVSSGVWKPVHLLQYAARITDVHVRTTARGMIIKTAVEGEGQVVHLLTGAGHRAQLLEGDGEHEVENFDRWSPKHPHLYELQTWLLSETAWAELKRRWGDEVRSDAVPEVATLDSQRQRVGWCDVRLKRERDEWGESFEFTVDGHPHWMRGANWIPDHSFPALVDRVRLRDRLSRAKDMGFDMLRVWGGGLYECDDFYDLCDELGLFVWQDFPFACAYYPDDEVWQDVVRQEAAVNVRRLRNHVSLALWCGNNENLEMFRNRWEGERTPPRYYGENHYDHVLPDVVSRLDPGRPYIPTSPIGEPPGGAAQEGGNEKQVGPNIGGWGDQHCWDVWHGRGDWRWYEESTGRFSSEYGFASSPSLRVWQDTLGDLTGLTPRSPSVAWHDKTRKGTETFVRYVELHYPPSTNLEEWVYTSGLNQRDALRHGVEHYRRSEFCRGSLIWQLNDCWPVQSWAVLDSEGFYKPLAYELRRLYADVHVQIVRKNERITVWGVNDGRTSVEGPVRLTAHRLGTGEVLREWTAQVSLEANTRGPVLEADVSGLAVPETLLVAQGLGDGTFRLLAEPKAARLPEVAALRLSLAEEGVLQVATSTPVVDLWLTEDGASEPFAENALTYATPGVYRVRLRHRPREVRAQSLSGVHPIEWVGGPLG